MADDDERVRNLRAVVRDQCDELDKCRVIVTQHIHELANPRGRPLRRYAILVRLREVERILTRARAALAHADGRFVHDTQPINPKDITGDTDAD
jgi:hypothetical protein